MIFKAKQLLFAVQLSLYMYATEKLQFIET